MTGDVVAAEVSRLGWRAQRRPRPGFAHVLGAAAGAFVVVGIVAFIVEVAPTTTRPPPGVGFTAALAIVALAAGFLVPGPIRSACVTAFVLTVPLSGSSRSSATATEVAATPAASTCSRSRATSRSTSWVGRRAAPSSSPAR